MRSIIISLSFCALLILSSCASSTPSTENTSSSSQGDAAIINIPLLTGTSVVLLKTSIGDMKIELNANAAPKAVTNFVTHAKNGYYDNLTFHRVIKDFMIQGGDPEGTGRGGESVFGKEFEDEINAESYGLGMKMLSEVVSPEDLAQMPEFARGWSLRQYYEAQGYKYNDKFTSLPMEKGSVAMANRGPNTNGSQFFIIHAEKTPWLDGKHTVFGKVIEGMDILDKIANLKTDENAAPVEPVMFTVEMLE